MALVGLNIIGIQEAAKLNVVLAVLDFATQLLLVALGFVLIFSPHVIATNVHFGVAPTWSNFALAIPVAMIAYTGIETVSNLAEEARDPLRTRASGAISWVAIAVFAIYFTLPVGRALGDAGRPTPTTGTRPYRSSRQQTLNRQHGFKNDPVLGLVENLGICTATVTALAKHLRRHPRRDDPLHRDERRRDRRVADHVLDGLATGSCRSCSAGSTRSSRRRGSRSSSSPARSRRCFLLSGKVDFLGRMYAFGAMLSFTIAHVSVVRLAEEGCATTTRCRASAKPNFRIRGVDWPLFAIVGGLGTGLAWLVVVIRTPPTRYAGLGWLIVGFIFYVLYRRAS